MLPLRPPRRYRLLEPLGTGGEGSVWRARDRYREQDVALKLVAATHADATERLSREFLVLSRLVHPNISRVLDYGLLETAGASGEPPRTTSHESDAGAFYTSELVLGGNLLEWTAGTGRRWEVFLSLVFEALAALDYLASQSVHHGDLKPANLLLRSPEGDDDVPHLRLIDFGAALVRDRQRASELGTPAYLPAAGALSSPQQRDLYGLGVTLFHAAAGQLPFSLEPRAIAAWQARKTPARLEAVLPEAPATLHELIRRLTSYDRPERFGSSREALAFLKAKVPTPRHARGANRPPEAVLRAYDGTLDAVSQSLRERNGAFELQVISVPNEATVPRLVAQLTARLQVEGIRCVTFAGLDDPRAHEQLLELAEDTAGQPLPPTSSEESLAVELASRLESASVAVVLTDTGAVEAPRKDTGGFLRSLIPYLRHPDGRLRLPVILATPHSEDVLEALGLSGSPSRVQTFATLKEPAIRQVLRDFFCVEEVPDALVERVARASNGLPQQVEEATETLAATGVTSDCLGQLVIPADLPEKLVSSRSSPGHWDQLAPQLRAALGLLAASGAELTPEEAETTFRGATVPEAAPASLEAWNRALERLAALALARTSLLEGETRYAAFLPWDSVLLRDLLGATAPAVYDHLTRRFAAAPSHHPVALQAVTHQFVELGRLREASRWALVAARRLQRSGRLGEALGVLERLIPSLEGAPQGRVAALIRLRTAELLITRGRHGEAIQLLPDPGAGGPTWWLWHGGQLQSRAYEQAGDRAAAIGTLEHLLARETQRTQETSMARLEVEARLVPLYFAEGRSQDAKAARARCREILHSTNGGPHTSVTGARAVGAAASVEARFGAIEQAQELFSRALDLGRALGRRDLVQGTLNEVAIFHAGRQEWTEALRVFQESQELAEASTDRWTALKAVYNRAIAYYRLDDLERAETLFREARTRSDTLGRHSFSAAVWSGLAGVLREQGHLRETLRLYRRVIQLPSAFCRPSDRAVAHNNLADLYLCAGRLAKALKEAQTAQTIAVETANRFLRTLSLRTRGKVLLALGDTTGARADLEEALERAEEAGDHRSLAAVHYYLGRLHQRCGREEMSWRHFRRACHEGRSASNRTYLRAARLALGGLLLEHGRPAFARRLVAHLETPPDARRGSVAARVLRLRTQPDWPRGAADALRSIDHAARREGLVWESFLALRDAMRDTALGGKQKLELRYRIALHGRSLLERAPDKRRPVMARFWELSEDVRLALGKAGDEEASSAPKAHSAVERLLAQAGAGPGPVSLGSLLEASCQALGLPWLALIFDPTGESRPPVWVTPGSSTEPAPALPVAAIEKARGGDAPVLAPPSFALRVRVEQHTRVLCGGLPGSQSGSASTLGELVALRPVFSLVLRNDDLQAQLASETRRSDEVRSELRRLHADASRGGKELETALLSQRLELIELQSKASVGGAVPLLRSPVGRSAAMANLLERLPAIAARELPVLLIGESGVGKDLVARWIHHLSARRERPYVTELCNLAESLAEAELFGFVAGAFTGAVADRPGIFQLADGGSLYLDEVDTLGEAMQARLLRVLEEKRVRPVGATETIAVDCRLLSSTRRSLRTLDDEGALRTDLLYRLNTEIVEIPPLRDRPEDIPLLVSYLLETFARERGISAPYVPPQAMRRLCEHTWPGNVRELENELQRALARNPIEIGAAGLLSGERSPSPPAPAPAELPTLQDERRRAETALIKRALEAHEGNATRAARSLGITRRYLGTLLERYALNLADFKPPRD